VVLAAGRQGTPQAAAALDDLSRAYWYPLYAYVRRCGHSPEDAQDLTQEFFARLLAGNYLALADPHKGRFRSFLLAGLRNLLRDEHDRITRLKRGGGQVVSFDARTAEDRYRLEPADPVTPERLFERNWAAAMLERAACRLRDEYHSAGKAELYECLTEFRQDSAEHPSYAKAGAQLRLSASAVKSAIYRLRVRHRQLVRDEVAQTLENPADVDEEIRYLLRVLGS
jgi:RNA polymerase sigma factor (sigma-70 family)